MNKYSLSVSLIVSTLYGFQSSVIYAMEPMDVVITEPSQKNPSIKYANFAGLSDEQYIARCMPKLNDDQKKAALRVFNSLLVDGYAPIKEDGLGNGSENNGKVLPEGGYSFPPVKHIQRPFLEYCGTGPWKRILDIGAGNGNDTIPLLSTLNTQVIAVDIHQGQLDKLKQRVNDKLKTELPDLSKKFGTFKRNFADQTTQVPSEYVGKFHGANLSRVLHFLDGEQTETLLRNVASLLARDALISITVLSIKPGSREDTWFKKQEKEGVKDPGLMYYQIVKKLRKDPILLRIDSKLPGQYVLVNQDDSKLPGPGHKRECVDQTKKNFYDHNMEQGRFYHTLESLGQYLSAHFNILDSIEWDYDPEEHYLSVIAQKKS
jgi:SAM-dependent methyltransferase